MNKETGGPAFPVNSDNYASPDSTGMTLRDYFAAKAMQGLLVGDDFPLSNGVPEKAYKLADAMLKARRHDLALSTTPPATIQGAKEPETHLPNRRRGSDAMTKDEALKLALEALETIDGWLLARYPCGLMPKEQEAITAIKEVLAQPEQEPVAWICHGADGKHDIDFYQDEIDAIPVATMLYTNPPQRKPLTEKRIEELYSFWVVDCQDIVGFARAVERTVKGEV